VRVTFSRGFPEAGSADVVIDVLADDVQGLPELRGCLGLVCGHEQAGAAGCGASPAQETRWAAVGNRVMSRPVSAMTAVASLRLTPGISASRSVAASAAASGRGRGRR
jgi:hypothetical protein